MFARGVVLAAIGFFCVVGAAAQEVRPIPEPAPGVRRYSAVGMASWYGKEFHGHATANGEIFDMRSLSAAHKTLPLPSYARVTNLGNGRSIIVRVNDRGPFVRGRIVDVSARVANILEFNRNGLTKVRVDYVGEAPPAGSDGLSLLASLRVPGAPAVAARPAPEGGETVIARSAGPSKMPEPLSPYGKLVMIGASAPAPLALFPAADGIEGVSTKAAAPLSPYGELITPASWLPPSAGSTKSDGTTPFSPFEGKEALASARVTE